MSVTAHWATTPVSRNDGKREVKSASNNANASKPPPWSTPKDIKPKKGGLLDIMSEQLAEHLNTKETQLVDDSLSSSPVLVEMQDIETDFGTVHVEKAVFTDGHLSPSDIHVANDDVEDLDLALAIQLQEEEDALLWQQERHGPKGNVTVRHFEQQQRVYLAQERIGNNEDDMDEEEQEEGMDDEKPKKKTPPWKVRDKSLKGQGGDREIITKHDLEINGRKNSRRLESTVTNCGSLGDTLVPNRIYNDFQHRMRRIAHMEKGVSSRTVEEDSTRSKTLDAKTRLIMHRLLDAGVLDAVNYVVRTGKEGVIFHAVGPTNYARARPGKAPFPARNSPPKDEDVLREMDEDEEDEGAVEEMDAEELLGENPQHVDTEGQTSEYAVKVYKTTLTEFANRHEYVEGDHRFASLGQLSKQNHRKVVKIWAEKELKNMTRMYRAGIPCPEPIRLDRNVLIMSFIGEDGWGAPQLADLDLGTSHTKAGRCFVQVLLLARALWDRCKLVHADLSEFNVLFQGGKCYVVDVGQAVERQHPHAMSFLRRDVFNVLTYFYNKCKKTGCGGSDEYVDLVVDWIVKGTPEPERIVDGEEWAKYAKDLGSWTDYRLACKFGELLQQAA